MAGFYPDPVAPRLAYDIDGTIGVSVNLSNTSMSQLSQANLAVMNEEDNSEYSWINSSGQSMRGVFIFPQLRDVVGYFVTTNGNIGSRGVLEYSNDTTNGLDGNWTTIEAQWSQDSNFAVDKEHAREDINSITANGVKAIGFRFVTGNGSNNRAFRALHLYGRITDLETPDRLRIWHPTLDEPLDDNTAADGAHLDWGDVVRGTTADKTFRIKNNSVTQTANNILISTDVRTNTTPTLESQITYDYNSGGFGSTALIASLAPDAISPIVTVRRITNSSAALSLWTWRTIAEAGSWT